MRNTCEICRTWPFSCLGNAGPLPSWPGPSARTVEEMVTTRGQLHQGRRRAIRCRLVPCPFFKSVFFGIEEDDDIQIHAPLSTFFSACRRVGTPPDAARLTYSDSAHCQLSRLHFCWSGHISADVVCMHVFHLFSASFSTRSPISRIARLRFLFQVLKLQNVGSSTRVAALLTSRCSRIEDSIFEVKATASDTHFWEGRTSTTELWSSACMISDGKTAARTWLEKHRAVRRLRTQCERGKRTWSSSTQATIEISSFR